MLFVGPGCGAGTSLEWKSVKEEIRSQFPSVAQLPTADLFEWMESERSPKPLLIDAREPEEFAVSHLSGALRASSIEEALRALAVTEQDHPIVVYCSVGYRSSQLAEGLQHSGYINVYNLEGSIFQWANEGRPVYRGSTAVEVVHNYDSYWGQLLRPELRLR
jgi:rhodanese-related sulfurtransferase